MSDVCLQNQQVVRGAHPGTADLRPVLWPGDESESSLHPRSVAHSSERGLRYAQPGVLCLWHPSGNGEDTSAHFEVPPVHQNDPEKDAT